MAVTKSLAKVLLVTALVFSFATQSFAQGTDGTNSKPSSSGPRKQLATILFMGLGGAVLGLSTLSFYGRPQDRLSNIAIGFAFGVIAGTSYVTYKAATNPQEMYGLQLHDQSGRGAGSLAFTKEPAPFKAGWTFEF
jgi:hypothetical protein